MGYRKQHNDEFEPHVHYQRRTANLGAFMAAIWISSGRQGRNLHHPFGIENGWKYLVNILNAKPNAMYCHLLEKILQISGSTLHAVYGKQFVKIIKFLHVEYLPKIKITDQDDDVLKSVCDRLKSMLENFFKDSSFPQPKGKLPSNYW